MKTNIIILSLFFLLFSWLFPKTTLAAKTRVRKTKAQSAVVYVSRGVKTAVRFRSDRLGLILNFSNFDELESGRYELVYNANGISQGAGGSVILGDSSDKQLLFATCSGGVCTFHENIQNARLSIISVLKDGTTVLKPYRIKV
ncbi:hypothetical protein ACFLZ1_02390 [Patescibacteria group bacterium]